METNQKMGIFSVMLSGFSAVLSMNIDDFRMNRGRNGLGFGSRLGILTSIMIRKGMVVANHANGMYSFQSDTK